MINDQLRCPDCESEIVVEVINVFKKRYEILGEIDPSEAMPISAGKDPPPTFNIALPVDALPKVFIMLKCRNMTCGRVFKDAATNIYVDTIWQNVGLENFKAGLFKLDSKSEPIKLKLSYRPKEPV